MTVTDTLINRVFDRRYLIVRKLGAGGMANVYLAEDQELGRRVALKMLNDRHAHDEQFVERFRREAKNAAGLSHPNIVSIYDRGEAEGTYYIAMEYLDGRTLKELLIRNGPTPTPIAIDYARQILAAVAFAHRNGIVHRDIKPHNVMVGADGRLKVTDFGIARSGTSQMTEAGSIIGTAQYLSPEQARGATVDQTSDLYSVGIVLYEMLTGEVPFSGDTPVEIAMKHLSTVPRPPSELRPEVSHDLDSIVLRALAKEPGERYASAGEMDADLGRVARGLSVARETEDAATMVLSGSGIAAPTMVTRPVATAPRPADYRRPASQQYYEYDAPIRRPRSVWPWLLALLLVLAASVAGFYVYKQIQNQLNANTPVAVPLLLNLKSDLAVQQLHDRGLRSRTKLEPSADVPKGEVFDQDPSAGDRIDKGNVVTITVSSGKPKAVVPDVRGKPIAEAVSAIVTAKLEAKVNYINSDKAQGTVTAQSPAPEDTVLEGTTVHINVSKGPKPIAVPNEIGQPYANALSALQGAGFAVARLDVESDLPKDSVVAMDPHENTLQPSGATITVSVSKGPKISPVPDVTQNDQATATQILRNSGFKVVVGTVEITDPSQEGTVLYQDPAGGTKAKQGTPVTITVGKAAAPAATTTSTTTTLPNPP